MVAYRTFLFAMFWSGLSVAGSFTISADQTVLDVGESAVITVRISDLSTRAEPQWPHLQGWIVRSAGRENAVSFGTGGRERTTIYRYEVLPPGPGKWTIPPLSLKTNVGGLEKVLESNSIAINVRKTDEDGPATLWLTQSLYPPSPYAGQMATWILRIGYASAADDIRMVLPDMGGLLQETGLEPLSLNASEEIDGVTYQVVEKRIPVFALQPGSYTVGPAQATVRVPSSRRSDNFFGIQFGSRGSNRTLTAPGLDVTVRSIETDDRPQNDTGLVGTLRIDANLDRQYLGAGEGAELKLNISGDANLRDLTIPWPQVPDLRFYPSAPSVTLRASKNGAEQAATISTAIVPTTSGTVELPAFDFSWFDPQIGAYNTKTLGPWTIEVAPGAGFDGQSVGVGIVGKQPVQVLGSDILPPRRVRVSLMHRSPASQVPLVAALLLLPLLFIVGGYGTHRVRLRYADPIWRARNQARTRARTSIAEAKTLKPGVEQTARYRAALGRFIADCTDPGASGLSDAGIVAAVEHTPVKEQIVSLLNGWSQARFGGATPVDDGPTLLKLIDTLDGVFPR